MPGPEQTNAAHKGARRFAWTVLVVLLLALVIVPNAAALRFTDDSRVPPAGAVGSRYFHQFVGHGGCGPALPYQFRILNGSLPPGLSLASNGLVSGTPTQGGRWSFWVELSDQDPPSADWCTPRKSEEEFTINVGAKGTVPDAAGPAASGGGGFSANPCDLPMVGNVCDAVSGAVTKVAAEAGEFVMRGVTAWVTNAAVWLAGKVGELIEKTTSPDLTASWFEGQYSAMVARRRSARAPDADARGDPVGHSPRHRPAHPRSVRLPPDGLHPRRSRDRWCRPARGHYRRHVERRCEQPRNRAVGQPAAGGRRRLQECPRRGLGDPPLRRLPRRDHPRDRRVRALARDDHP